VPFFFQHGLGGDTERVFALLGALPGCRLLGLDCHGHGKTMPLRDVQKLGFNSFADDVMALMEHLEIQQAIIGGTSMGAGVALNCALRYPARVLGLVLLRPAWLDSPMTENARIFTMIAELIRRHGRVAGAEIFKQSTVFATLQKQSPDSANSSLEHFGHPRASETVAKFERIPLDAPNHDRAEWRRIAVPTLVLANRQDPIHPYEFGVELAREIPNAEFAELTPKSSDLQKYTAELRAQVTRFLQKHF